MGAGSLRVQGPGYGQHGMSQEQCAAMAARSREQLSAALAVGLRNAFRPRNRERAFQLLEEARARHPEWQVKRLDTKKDVVGDVRGNGVNWDCFDGEKWVTGIDSPYEFFHPLNTV